MKKQTAVEWLIKKIAEDYPEIPKAYREECNKAKEIEKEHIMMAYNDGYVNAVFKGTRKPIEYYNETYGDK
jgi:hypothetical protein